MSKLLRGSRRLVGAAIPLALVVCSTGTAAGSLAVASEWNAQATVAASGRGEALRAYDKLNLSFVANRGQTHRSIRYYAQGADFRFAFGRSKVMLAFTRSGKGAALSLRFPGASRNVEPQPREPDGAKVSFLRGNDPTRWLVGLPTHRQIVYRNLWPDIDLVFRGAGGRLKYEFVVRPGARIDSIRVAYRGAQRVSVARTGHLDIRTPLGVLRDARPVTYQDVDGTRALVSSRYVLAGTDTVGFAVGRHALDRPLVIDPGLVYSTFLGGSNVDQGRGVAVDPLGSAAVTGLTLSANFPTTPGAFDPALTGPQDAFVTRLDPTGTSAIYSTYLGGSGSDSGFAIAVDASGNAVVTGTTDSTNFPITAGAADPIYGGSGDAFATKFSALGSLVFSTYLGGTGNDQGFGVAVDPLGDPTVVGATGSMNFPVTPLAFDPSFNGQLDAFSTKLSPTGSLVFSTYLGGALVDAAEGVRLDAAGNPLLTGRTTSVNFPTFAAFDPIYNGAQDAFVTKLNATESLLLFSTYLGGTNQDAGHAINLDFTGSPLITGETRSTDFPTLGYDTTYNGGTFDAFVTKLAPTGSAPVFSTYLGGASSDQGFGIAPDALGNSVVAGSTSSADFPVTPGAYDTSYNGAGDAFVTKLALTGTNLLYSTFLGGTSTDNAFAADVDPSAIAYVAGFTFSGNYPTTPLAYDRTFAVGEAFVTKLDTVGAPYRLVLTPVTDTNPVGAPHTVTATVTDFGGQPVAGVTVRFSVPTSVATFASPSSGSDTTDANGQAEFTFTAALPGMDTIEAYADSDDSGVQDPGEPTGAATKFWTLPPSTEFCEVKIIQGGWIYALNGDRASFGGSARVSDGSVQGQEQYQDHGPADPRNVHSIELTAMTCSDDLTSGTIFGRATIDGSGDFVFRIDVTDQGSGGSGDSYGIMMSDGYASGQRPLEGGNVTIHKN